MGEVGFLNAKPRPDGMGGFMKAWRGRLAEVDPRQAAQLLGRCHHLPSTGQHFTHGGGLGHPGNDVDPQVAGG